MIRLTCDSCQQSLVVKDVAAGKKVKCPRCQKVLAVPLPAVFTGTTRSYHAAGPNRELWDFLAPAENPDEIGRLGGYRVLKVLGAGGMGVVFQAEDPKLRRKVALKAMLPVLAASETARKRFLREAQTAAAIEHDHIVPIFQVGEERGVPFIAMPLLKGESLATRVQRDKTLAVAEVLRIGREVATGLAAAHAAGLVHRDIKPANLWLEGDEGRVKILDFGLARAAAASEQLTQQGAVLGTPGYMAPEQAAGQAVDGRCDLFSLGCVLYRMCTGRAPFKGPDGVATLVAVATQPPRPPAELRPELPRALSDLVMELLAKKPEQRPQSATAVAEALQRIQAQAVGRPAGRPQVTPPGERGCPELAHPPKPKGTVIAERLTPGGRTLTWPLPGSGVADYLQYLPHLSSLYLLFCSYQLLTMAWRAPGGITLSGVLTLCWPLLALVSGWRFCQPSRPERITLGSASFRHYLGQAGGAKKHLDALLYQGLDRRPWWRQLLGLPLVVEMPKEELGEVTLEGQGEAARLRYDSGVDRVEIGRHLRKREKEWLAAVIREWQQGQ